MKEHFRSWKIGAGLFLFTLALAACGGGGGGGSGLPSAYSGETSQATFTDTNAQTIVAGAWEGGMVGAEVRNVTPTQAAGETPAFNLPGVLGLAQVLKAPVLQANPATTSTIKPAETLPPVTGDCGGTATTTVNTNQTTGAFSGQTVFASFCSQGVTINGTMPFSGQVDLTQMVTTQLNLTLSNLGVSSTTESATLNGSASFTLASDLSNETDTLNYVLTDNGTGKTYFVDHYVANIIYGATSSQTTLKGRYYDNDYGFVDITTSTALTTPDTASQPAAGALLFAGKNSQAQLSFSSSGSTLGVDANGDGTFETTIPNPI